MAAVLYPPKGEDLTIAVIDPAKQVGEEGQYVKSTGSPSAVLQLAAAAREAGKEVRFYYQGLTATGNEPVASKIIVTWIPPRHVQPFHTHHRVHEMTLMVEGEILAVDSDTLTEDDLRALVGKTELYDLGHLVREHEMVIEGPGTRHTVLNPTDRYAVMHTVQTARMGIEKFDSDWERDKPNTSAAA